MCPIPESGRVYYFEVTIECNPTGKYAAHHVNPTAPFPRLTCQLSTWAVGFCEEHTPLNLHVGWGERSWGYHSDDGSAFAEGSDYRFGEGFGENDTVGCGINFDRETAFFTKNGRIVGMSTYLYSLSFHPGMGCSGRAPSSLSRVYPIAPGSPEN